MKKFANTFHMIVMAAAVLPLAACTDTAERLSRVGKKPDLAEVRNPQENAEYKEMTWPTPEEPVVAEQGANSLWQAGSKAFFKDQRAGRVGDILRVKITIDDKAQLDNETKANRSGTNSMGVPSFFGLERDFRNLARHEPDPAALIETSGESEHNGKGNINRKEKITTELAALVTQVLPNGNLVISGKQEILVNSEVREVGIGGVVRPEDIASDNTVQYYQVAEARIVYGGRGTVSDIQTPRYGAQLIEAISPF